MEKGESDSHIIQIHDRALGLIGTGTYEINCEAKHPLRMILMELIFIRLDKDCMTMAIVECRLPIVI